MRTKAAAAVIVLFALAAAPEALAKGSVTIPRSIAASLYVVRVEVAPVALKSKTHTGACQAGQSRSRTELPGSTAPLSEAARKASAVACEQPPRSYFNVSGAMKHAETGALAANG